MFLQTLGCNKRPFNLPTIFWGRQIPPIAALLDMDILNLQMLNIQKNSSIIKNIEGVKKTFSILTNIFL
jgi:hypothetical protein